MNKIIKYSNLGGEVTYECITDDGEVLKCKRWFEKKTGKWHVKLPDGNSTGRTYIREDKIVDDEYEFETKTEHRVLGETSDRSWKSRLEPEELRELEEHEKRISELKELALSRPKKELTEQEKLEKQIKALQARLKKLAD